MIKITQRITASAVWDIEGTEVRLPYRKEYPEPVMRKKIEDYRSVLESGIYEQDNIGLCEAFTVFGGIAFVAIGLTCREAFLQCFSYYAMQFVQEWADGEKCLKSKYIGYEYVFAKMLKNEAIRIHYDFRYILDQANGGDFCQMNEAAFAEYWISVIWPLMKSGLSLSEVSNRVGDVRVSRYLMRIPDQTLVYLKGIAGSYTQRRELISLTKMINFILGNDSRTGFTGAEPDFLKLLKQITEEEKEIQRTRFIKENRKEMSLHKDVWILYQRHGTGLKLLTVDFRKVNQPSFRKEIKCFLKMRFSGHIRASDRSHLSIFDAVNRICEMNDCIRYFSDIDHIDVKKLQLSLEQEMDQSKIMTMFSACRTLYHYLCSDENDSKLPKPHSNPFESLHFVNAKKYHKNTPYILDKVIEELSDRLEELDETDRLVFQIFSETGMRAKEVAFLEEDCLETARYDGAVKLKYIPYKTLKARRRNGIGEYHSVYISAELAEKIKKQITTSEELRREYSLPYIFLHQKKGYKVAMLNVEYFITKINKLIYKYEICDDSGGLWNFTSRQCRKTLVVNMIENGATTMELVYQLGHLNQGTVMQYYAEVKSARLAEMNTKFFKEQFHLLLSKEQLTTFSEEERRLLFVDFRLGKRRVEFGFCTRKLCDGACKSRSRSVHCANCPHLCTGIKYLPFWRELLQDQEARVQEMIKGYQRAEIADYEEYIEYRQEKQLLAVYRNIVEMIEKSGGDCL